MLYLKFPKNIIKKLIELINSCSKVVNHKINTQKSIAFL